MMLPRMTAGAHSQNLFLFPLKSYMYYCAILCKPRAHIFLYLFLSGWETQSVILFLHDERGYLDHTKM